MGWTKRDVINQAFQTVGLASYSFDLSAEELQSALRSLDAMMAVWDAKGARLGYALPSSPGSSDLDTQTGVPDWAVEAMYMSLGPRLAAGLGKAVMPEIKIAAKQAYNVVLARTAELIPMQLDRMQVPAGAGNHWQRGPYLQPIPVEADIGPDNPLEFTP